MTNIITLENVNAHRWSMMHVRADRLSAFHATAQRLCSSGNKARYQGVSDRLQDMIAAGEKDDLIIVPWWFVAIVSEREYGGPPHWDKQLGQGDALHDGVNAKVRYDSFFSSNGGIPTPDAGAGTSITTYVAPVFVNNVFVAPGISCTGSPTAGFTVLHGAITAC